MPKKGYKQTEEHKRKIGIGELNKGKTVFFSKETRKKLSEATKRRWINGTIISGMIGKHHSAETKEKMGKSKKEFYKNPENHPHWKGGISKEPYSFDFNKELKELIKKRDNYTCQVCGKNPIYSAIHHIDYDKKNCNPDNLITLCRKCNTKVNFNREYWKKYFLTA